MEVVYGGRGSGKTSELISMAVEDPSRVIVCRSERDAERIRRQAIRDYDQHVDVITCDQLLRSPLWAGKKRVLIDEVDSFLQYVCRGMCETVTLTPVKLRKLEVPSLEDLK